jgi:peptide/nickel transport system substrate-binding protein
MAMKRTSLIPDGGLSRRAFLRLTGVGAAAMAAGSPALTRAADRLARPTGSPRRGGSLRLGNTADVISFEPYAVSDNVSIWTMLLLYDQLTRPTKDGLSVEPNLAQSWDISPDGQTYTFHLRPGVRFHDGSPVTAADVKFCVERAAFAKNTQWAFILAALKGMEVVDQHTVRAHLHHPHAPFLADMALFATSIYPSKLFEQMGKKLWQHPIGTGSFKFASWKRGSEVVLTRNAHFWRNNGQPYVDSFHNMVVADPNTRVLQVQSGELDIALFPPLAQAKSLQGNPSVTVHVDNFMESSFVPLNVTKPPLNNKLVRQALNYAVDKEAVVKHVLFGFGTPSGQALPVMFGYDPSIKPYPYNPAKANALLKQAGYPHGFSLQMLVDASNDEQKSIATLMQEEFAQIGVKMSIRTMEEVAFLNLIENPPYNYQIAPGYMTSDIIDPDELVSFAMAGDAGTLAIWTLYNNKTVNSLARQAAETADRQKRLQLYYKMDRIHHDDAPLLFLYHAPSVSLTSSAVQGFKVLPTGNYRLEEVWMQK